MNVIPINECCKSDFHITFLGSMEMSQRVTKPAFSSLDHPKKQDMLLFVSDCRTQYFTHDGKIINTKDGDVVYVPKGSRYRVECLEDSDESCTFQINFLLYDNDFQPMTLANEITVYSYQTPIFRSLFEKSVMIERTSPTYISAQKSILFELLGALSEKSSSLRSSSIIDNGVEYLLSHYCEDPSVSELADLCHVSNEYFRKLFKAQMGQSPTEYKNNLRLKKAEQYLLFSDMSIAEISEQLSFATVSHFIKRFKDTHGCSPLTYRHEYGKNDS